jgi:hypothetical protein
MGGPAALGYSLGYDEQAARLSPRAWPRGGRDELGLGL